jgi:hypothetical protein
VDFNTIPFPNRKLFGTKVRKFVLFPQPSLPPASLIS